MNMRYQPLTISDDRAFKYYSQNLSKVIMVNCATIRFHKCVIISPLFAVNRARHEQCSLIYLINVFTAFTFRICLFLIA